MTNFEIKKSKDSGIVRFINLKNKTLFNNVYNNRMSVCCRIYITLETFY